MIRKPIGKVVLTYLLDDEDWEMGNEGTPVLGVICKVCLDYIDPYYIKWADGEDDWYDEPSTRFYMEQAKKRKRLAY